MHFKTIAEDLRDMELAEERKQRGMDDEEFFSIIQREPFKDTDKDVVLIDPGMNVEEIFGGIDLPCSLERRINNTISAPKSLD